MQSVDINETILEEQLNVSLVIRGIGDFAKIVQISVNYAKQFL